DRKTRDLALDEGTDADGKAGIGPERVKHRQPRVHRRCNYSCYDGKFKENPVGREVPGEKREEEPDHNKRDNKGKERLAHYAPAPVHVDKIFCGERRRGKEREFFREWCEHIGIVPGRIGSLWRKKPDRDHKEDRNGRTGEDKVQPRKRVKEHQWRKEPGRVLAGQEGNGPRGSCKNNKDRCERRLRARVDRREEEDSAEAGKEGERKGEGEEQRQGDRDTDKGGCEQETKGEREHPEDKVVKGVLDDKVCKDEAFGERQAPGRIGKETCLPEPAVHNFGPEQAERTYHKAEHQVVCVEDKRELPGREGVAHQREEERSHERDPEDEDGKERKRDAPEHRRVDPPFLFDHRNKELKHSGSSARDRGRNRRGAGAQPQGRRPRRRGGCCPCAGSQSPSRSPRPLRGYGWKGRSCCRLLRAP